MIKSENTLLRYYNNIKNKITSFFEKKDVLTQGEILKVIKFDDIFEKNLKYFQGFQITEKFMDLYPILKNAKIHDGSFIGKVEGMENMIFPTGIGDGKIQIVYLGGYGLKGKTIGEYLKINNFYPLQFKNRNGSPFLKEAQVSIEGESSLAIIMKMYIWN